MYYVCCHEYGTTIRLAEFEDKSSAERFMAIPCLMASSDETEDGEEWVVQPDEMFIVDDENIPFYEPVNLYELADLPF